MKLKSLALSVAVGILIAGCGGGGGGTEQASANSPITAPVVNGVAAFSGNRADYTIGITSSGYTVTSRDSNLASSVTGAAYLRFVDMTINLGIANEAIILGRYRTKELIELYMAFFNRLPDANTLDAWLDRMRSGQTMSQIAESMYGDAVQAPDATGYSTSMISTEFVTAVYKQVFGMYGASAPTASDVEFWSSRIGKGGISRAALVLAMLEEARGGTTALAVPSVTALLDNKATVGDYFAIQQGINYNSPDESLVKTKEILAAVTPTDFLTAQGIIGYVDAAFNLRNSSK